MEQHTDVVTTLFEVRFIFFFSTVSAFLVAVVTLLTKKGFWGDDVVAPDLMEDDASVSGDSECYPGGELLVFYGSQTGSSECFAKEVEREAADHGFKTQIIDLGDFTEGMDFREMALDLSNELADGPIKALFCVSTYGEGEPPDPAAEFCRLIQHKAKEGNSQYLEGFEYAVFALGSTEYEHYAACGKLVDSKLSQIGAHRILKLGLGDDNQDIEGDFQLYKKNMLWPALQERYVDANSSHRTTDLDDDLVAPEIVKTPYLVEYVGSDVPSVDRRRGFPVETVVNSSRPYFEAIDCPIKAVRELRSNDDSGSTLHFDIDISKNFDIRYNTADNLAVLPVNDDTVVEKAAEKLDLDLQDRFIVAPASGKQADFKHFFPTPCSVKECLSRYCDLNAAPRRSEMKVLASFATNPDEKQQILLIASSIDFYREAVIEKRVGLIDLITSEFPSIQIPFDHFINVCPRLQPRYYTISSSSSVSPHVVSITVSILKEQKQDGSLFKGVCSNHLAEISKNGMCRLFIRPSTFRLPEDVSKPIIMIGPGTGIAPMRALLQERAYQRNVQNKNVGKSILYFGCKRPDVDYLYSDELEEYKKSGVLTDLHLAFSRERERKVYVQYLLAKNKSETFDLIHKEGAYIYVCGATKMGNDVRETLIAICSTVGNMNPDAARAYIAQLQVDGRFVQELWSS